MANDFRREALLEVQIAVIPVEIWEVESQKKCHLEVYTEKEK